jgi:ubiquinone/menaquinone biosynthesis C-methylase UbiE
MEQCRITLINLPGSYDSEREENEQIKRRVSLAIGDARDLSRFGSGSFDLVVCNSVVEHVGSWLDMETAAAEARRVGRSGWVQVPAFEFPIEQHYIIPFVHWFADPIQIKALALLHGSFKKRSFHDRHVSLHHNRPLTRTQLSFLFPDAEIRSEWYIFPKSHIATW